MRKPDRKVQGHEWCLMGFIALLLVLIWLIGCHLVDDLSYAMSHRDVAQHEDKPPPPMPPSITRPPKIKYITPAYECYCLQMDYIDGERKCIKEACVKSEPQITT